MGFKQKRMRNSKADPAFVSDFFTYVLLCTPPIIILGSSSRLLYTIHRLKDFFCMYRFPKDTATGKML